MAWHGVKRPRDVAATCISYAAQLWVASVEYAIPHSAEHSLPDTHRASFIGRPRTWRRAYDWEPDGLRAAVRWCRRQLRPWLQPRLQQGPCPYSASWGACYGSWGCTFFLLLCQARL